MQVQQSWQFSLVVACLFSGVTAVMLCIVLVVANQSSIQTGTSSSRQHDYDARIVQLERQIMDLELRLEKTEENMHKLELASLNLRTDHSGDSFRPRDASPVYDATTVKSEEKINRNEKDYDDILQDSFRHQVTALNSELDEEDVQLTRWSRSSRSSRSSRHKERKRGRVEREPKQCVKRCKGAKGDKGDAIPPVYGGEKGQKGDIGPVGKCECPMRTIEPETTYATTTAATTQGPGVPHWSDARPAALLAAHFEGGRRATINTGERRDPINRGYVDLSEIDGGWVPHWRYAPWMDEETRNKFHLNHRGNVTVVEGGIYYVYSQMLYYDPSVFMGHSLYIGNQKRFSCTECTVDRDRKFNTCYIGGVVQIQPGEKVGVRVSYANRVINLNPDNTHFGMIRLS